MTAPVFAPGVHFETANVRNLLAAHGIETTEAMCLGIGGGIAAGYQYCPSVQNYTGLNFSGVQFVPRVKLMSTNGSWYRDSFSRLGLATEVRESTGKKASLNNLTELLAEGKPVVAWATPLGLAYSVNWTATCGMYTVLIHAIENGEVVFSDHISVRRVPLENMNGARDRVCSLKNRVMALRGGKVSAAQWKSAIADGIRETAGDFAKPRLGTFNLPGLKEGIGLVNGKKNKRAWPVVFPGEKLLLPMRDAYESIELVGGGGLLRPLYAAFLDEAGAMLKNKELRVLADTYRALGTQWTALANFLLPEPFAATKAAMHKLAAGDDSQKDTLNKLAQKKFPMNEAQSAAFLDEVSARMSALYDAESAAAVKLGEAAANL